jgi:hypothetical protein
MSLFYTNNLDSPIMILLETDLVDCEHDIFDIIDSEKLWKY